MLDGTPAIASAGGQKLPPKPGRSPAFVGPWGRQTRPATVAAGWPVSSSHARLIQTSRKSALSQNAGSRDTCRS